jgi:hypothetical protein
MTAMCCFSKAAWSRPGSRCPCCGTWLRSRTATLTAHHDPRKAAAAAASGAARYPPGATRCGAAATRSQHLNASVWRAAITPHLSHFESFDDGWDWYFHRDHLQPRGAVPAGPPAIMMVAPDLSRLVNFGTEGVTRTPAGYAASGFGGMPVSTLTAAECVARAAAAAAGPGGTGARQGSG